MATSGQTLNDRINAARYALAGQGLARCVCKATTEEVIGPKKKHLDYLLACTHEPNVSIPQLANLLIERTNHIYWVVVFKALVTVHHLMSYGNERFTQYLASSNYSFELSTFLDKTAARDFSMSTFIRRYSRYINEKALSYRLLAFDFCKVKRGNEGVLRVMPIDRLLKTLPVLQNQLDALLEFDCSANDLNNGVINACFMLLFRDLIGLFACHNDGIINLLNKYFTLNRKMCREAFDLYKKFLIRMDKVSDFLRVAEVVGIDKDEIPDLRRAPSSLIEALEQHLQNIESNKKILKQQSSNSGGKQQSSSELTSVIGNLTPPSSRRPNSPSSSGSAQTSTGAATSGGAISTSGGSHSDEFSINSFKDDEVRKALEEEARVLSQYGSIDACDQTKSNTSKLSKSSVTSRNGAGSPKFAVTTIPKSIDDIFGDSDAFAATANNTNNTTNNNNNGFVDKLSAFDNQSTTSSSSSTAKQRPDFDSIKSTIKSATTTLEKSSGPSSALKGLAPPPSSKKASDDLFCLLDAPSATPAAGSSGQIASCASSLVSSAFDGPLKSQAHNLQTSPIGPFASTSPFEILAPMDPIVHQTNGGQLLSKLKPGNPFPEVVGDFATNTPSAFRSTAGTSAGTSAFAVATTKLIQPFMPTGISVFKSTTSSSATTTANYTNLGGLEGFGDLLQPMSSSTNNNNNKSINHGGSCATQFGTTKPSFNSGSSLANTGLFKGDLDSTLANLAQNLTFDGIAKTKK